ncbi:MAG: hypothetical protein ACOYT8_01605 [Candidatus Dependentiae bacterium]
MKKYIVLLLYSLNIVGHQFITEVDQTKPLYFPVAEYSFEIKNKSHSPITLTLINGEKTVFIKQPINLCARAAGLKTSQPTQLIIAFTNKKGAVIEQLYSFEAAKTESGPKKIILTWTGTQLKPQGGNFIYYRSMSGIPLKDNVKKVTLVTTRQVNTDLGDQNNRKKS